MPSTLFPWLSLEPSSVIRACRLEAHEMGQEFTDEDLTADASEEIETAAGDVMLAVQGVCKGLAWPLSTAQWASAFPDLISSERDSRRNLQTVQANKVVKALAVAALRRSNGSEESISVSQATADGRGEAVIGNARIGSAESMLARLLSDVGDVATRITNAADANKGRRLGAILMGIGD